MKYIVLIIAIALYSTVGIAQIGLSSFTSDGLQNFRLNPALTSFEKRIFVGLGHVNFDGQNSSGDLFKAIEKDNNDDLLLDLEVLVNSLDDNNTININNEVMTFYLGTRISNWRVGLYHSFRSVAEIDYPKDVVELLWYGNAPYIGKTLNIAPSMDYVNYNQLGLHLAYQRNNLHLGININRLFGTAYAHTNKSVIDFHTDEEFYEISVNTDYEIISASSLSYDEPYTLRVEDDTWSELNLESNTGWSVDLGASYDIGEKIKVHGFIRDLGHINFDDNVKRIYSNKNFIYSGGVFDAGVLDEENDFQIGIDTILKELEFESEDSEAFKYELSSSWGLGVNYKWTERTELYFLSGRQESLSKEKDYKYFQLGVHRNFFKFLKFNLNYSYKYESSNLGMGLSVNPGPLDFYLYTDNVLSLLSPGEGQRTALMLGFSLQI